MKAQIILLGMLLAVGLASGAWGGIIEGDIIYQNCSCSDYFHRVCIKPFEYQDCWYTVPVLQCSGIPKYQTGQLSPGWYYLYVILQPGTDCDHAVVHTVYHSGSNQWVNLKVLGPSGGGSRPPGP
jgi:hypothetical protein